MNLALGTPGPQSPSADPAISCQPQWWDHLCRLKRTPCCEVIFPETEDHLYNWAHFHLGLCTRIELLNSYLFLAPGGVPRTWVFRGKHTSSLSATRMNRREHSLPTDGSGDCNTPHQPLPQIPDWYQNYTPLQQQPSSLWMDRAFVLLIHLVIALLLAKQKKEKHKRKGGGKTYITFTCIWAWGFQLLIKTLTFGPVGLCAWFMGYRGPWSHLSVCGVCGWGYGVCTFGSVHYMFAL